MIFFMVISRADSIQTNVVDFSKCKSFPWVWEIKKQNPHSCIWDGGLK
jgi:hypothetical protein